MTARERFIQTMLFGSPDRMPYQFGYPRESTFQAWYLQGLPRDVDFYKFVGMDHWERLEALPIDFGPVPAFESVVLEETAAYKIWIDGFGAKRMDYKEQPTPGFQTRTWLEFPVKNRTDFRAMTHRYDPHSRGRLPENWKEAVARYRNRDFVLGMAFPSVFWRTRDWVGFEGLCTIAYDDPFLLHEMMQFVADFTIELLDDVLDEVDLDYVWFQEDMAYKTASMISPSMVKEFMWPRHRQLVRFFRDKGVSVLMVDCDGHIGELIPLWLDVGINAVYPVEIAANNDPVAYRKKYGKNFAMIGGIDKRELRFDKDTVRREIIETLQAPWMIEQGGFIPQVDHGVPPDIPLRNFLYMSELLKEIACGGSSELWNPSGELERLLGPIEEMWNPDKAYAFLEEEEQMS